jgi:enolase
LFGLPLLDISFRFGPNRMPVPAVGVIAIGQFAAGIVTIAQFSVGVFSLSQFTLAFYAVAQVAIAWSCIAQVGLYVERGYGQAVWQIGQLLGAP